MEKIWVKKKSGTLKKTEENIRTKEKKTFK